MQQILIIEDEQAYVHLLSDKLRGKYKILTAENGKLGLEMAIENQPELILLDNVMPIMDGMTMLAELRRDPYGKIANVIILTNLEASSSIIADTIKALPLYYFVKSDTSLDVLIEEIDELMSEPPVNSLTR